MDTKHIHCMLEDVAKYGKEIVSCMVGDGNVNLQDLGEIIDIVKDLACAEKDALIAKEMRKANEEDEAEEKYIRKMLKEENKEEYKRMREEYGEDEGERRFYDNYRYKSSGRFAPKGKGSYMPRRGYEEPPYYHMNPEMYKEHDPEWYRDMDRQTKGVMYFSSPMSGNMSGGNSSVGNGNSGNSSGNVRSYTEGFEDGQTRGYSEGYERGRSDGRNSQSRDRREGRSGQSRRGYMETKEAHKENTPENKQHRMKELETYAKELTEDVVDMIADATPEERSLMKQKMQVLLQKL